MLAIHWKFDIKASAVFANLLNDRWLEGSSTTPERFRLALNSVFAHFKKRLRTEFRFGFPIFRREITLSPPEGK